MYLNFILFKFVFVQKPVQWAAPGSPAVAFPISLADSASSGVGDIGDAGDCVIGDDDTGDASDCYIGYKCWCFSIVW